MLSIRHPNRSHLRFALAALLVASLLFVSVSAEPQIAPKQPAPVILSGNDIGFQLEDRNGGNAVGTFVVRIDGQWVPAVSAPKVIKPLLEK